MTSSTVLGGWIVAGLVIGAVVGAVTDLLFGSAVLGGSSGALLGILASSRDP